MTKLAEQPAKDCFIVCPIGNEQSPERKRSDTLLKHVFTPVLAKYGYVAIRADQIPKAGLITSQIINLIVDSPLVIADLTGGNPNVFYELAIRHATGKPYLQVIEKGERMPFDVSGFRTIQIDTHDINSIEEAKEQMRKQIAHFDAGHKADSPISIATNVKIIQSDASYAERLFNKLDEMHGFCGWTSIDDLGDKLDDIERILDEIKVKIE